MFGWLVVRTVAHLAGLCWPPVGVVLTSCWWSPAACLTVISVEKRVFIRVLITYVYSACQGFYYIYFGAFLIHMSTYSHWNFLLLVHTLFVYAFVGWGFVCYKWFLGCWAHPHIIHAWKQYNSVALCNDVWLDFISLYCATNVNEFRWRTSRRTFCCVCIKFLFSAKWAWTPTRRLDFRPSQVPKFNHREGFCTFKQV